MIVETENIQEEKAALLARSAAHSVRLGSANTVKSYKGHWVRFEAFCGLFDFPFLCGDVKLESESVGHYLTYLDSKAPSTVSQALSALRKIYHLETDYGKVNPAVAEIIGDRVKAVRQYAARPIDQKDALLIGKLDEIVDLMAKSKKREVIIARDKALLLLGWWTAFRRTEVVSLRLQDVRFVSGGMWVHLRESKTDKAKLGRDVFVSEQRLGRKRHCPVRGLRRFLEFYTCDGGVLFPGFDRGYGFLDKAISDRTLADRVKYWVSEIGLDADDFAGHSLRRGFITSMFDAGVDVGRIQCISGHTSTEMALRYNENKDKAGMGLPHLLGI